MDSIGGRDPATAAAAVRHYHRQVLERIRSVRKGEGAARSDDGLTEALTAWLRTNAGLGGQSASRNRPPS